MKTTIAGLLVLLFFAFAGSPAFASCAPDEFGVPACAYYTRADAVFVGKALKVEALSEKDGFEPGLKKVRFQVLQNLKGVENPTLTIVSPERKGDCGPNIKTGQTWVIYAGLNLNNKFFYEFRGRQLDQKAPDAELDTLKSAAAGKTETTFAGRLGANRQQYAGAAVDVVIENRGRSRTQKTDAEGGFSFAPLAEGKYKVRLSFPYRAKLTWDERLLNTTFTPGPLSIFEYEVTLNDGDCVYNFFDVLKIDQ